MPLLEFYCENCQLNFEKIFAVRADYKEGEVICEKCGKADGVKRRFASVPQVKFLLTKSKKINLIDKGYKMSKDFVPPGLKRLN
ncbi:MAG: hypothetical protein QMC67_06705 [Candidatus Wallbacteria bacterium]